MTGSDNRNEQVIPVLADRLKQVKVTNTNGRTFIVGTNKPEIKVRSLNGNNFSPSIEVKNDGEEVEIRAVGGIKVMVNFGQDDNIEEEYKGDPDIADSFPDFPSADEPQAWGFPDSSIGRSEYRQARENFRRSREAAKEAYRQAREQQRRAERDTRRGHEFRAEVGNISLEAGNLGGIIRDVTNNIGEIFNQFSIGNNDLFIEVPEWVELDVKTTSGNLEIGNMNAFCRLRCTNGATKLQNLKKGLQFKGASGRVDANGLAGNVTVKLASGNLHLRQCELTGLDISSNSGNISVETILAEGADNEDYRINATNGQVGFGLPPNSRATIECRTLSGRIIAGPEFGPVNYRNRPGQSRFKIDMNKGGRKVNITTINGNIELGLYHPDNSGSTQYEGSMASWPNPPEQPEQPNVPSSPVEPPFIRYRPPVVNASQPGNWPPVPENNSSPIVTPPPVVHNWPSAEAKPVEEAEENKDNSGDSHQSTTSNSGSEDKRQKQLEVLQAIERGEMSVEEGMALLSHLED